IRSTTMASGAAVDSAGVKATSTRTGREPTRRLRLRRARVAQVLPPSGPRDGRLVLRVRARNLPRLHGLRAGWDPLPRPRRGARRDAQAVAREGRPPLV